jgi:LmbE family N-acetylglucosaminyl deacetylase
MKKKVFIGIFAHPDDESFGPSGTLALQIKEGADVFLVLATDGNSGNNPDNHENLGKIRLAEWKTAGQLLGVKEQFYLGYEDGRLSNDLFVEIASKVEKIVAAICEKYDKTTEVTLISMDQNGISGHIDHIVMSYVSCFVYTKLQEKYSQINKLWLTCISRDILPEPDTSFVFRSRGRSESEIDLSVDITEVYELKKSIMRAHKTQRDDAEMIISRLDKSDKKTENFYYFS